MQQARLAELVDDALTMLQNLMRLLELLSVASWWVREKLTMGYARALINAPEPAGRCESDGCAGIVSPGYWAGSVLGHGSRRSKTAICEH
jgi:hypothetical protein